MGISGAGRLESSEQKQYENVKGDCSATCETIENPHLRMRQLEEGSLKRWVNPTSSDVVRILLITDKGAGWSW